jgi:hypothetical protein
MRSVDMDFHYRSSLDGSLPETYERLLLEALAGDASLFTRSDSVEAAWKLLDPLLQGWEAQAAQEPVVYPVGSWGQQKRTNYWRGMAAAGAWTAWMSRALSMTGFNPSGAYLAQSRYGSLVSARVSLMYVRSGSRG